MRLRMNDLGLLALRLCVGLLMLTHGVPKLLRYEELPTSFPDPLGIGAELSAQLVVGAEVGCAVLIIVGLFTRLAAIPLLCTMLVAALVHHASDGWAQQELPLLYAAAFLTLLLTGPGARSVDGWFERQVRGVGGKATRSVSEVDTDADMARIDELLGDEGLEPNLHE